MATVTRHDVDHATSHVGGERRLRRELGVLEVTTLAAGSMIGSGIFVVPAYVAGAFPNPWLMALLWLLGGVVSLAGALTFAELTTMFPVSGGPYVFMREAYGRFLGFLAGWAMLLGKLFVGPAVALVFARYLSFLVPLTDRGVVLMAAWAVVAVSFANYLGVKHGGRVQNLFTTLKVGALLLVVGLAFVAGGGVVRPDVAPREASWSLALLGITFAYNSWFNPTFVAEEVRDPKRDLPLGLALGVLVVAVVYVAASVAYAHLLGTAAMSASDLVAADAAGAAVAWGGVLVAWGVLVSTFGNLNGGTMVTARLVMAMSRDGYLPRALAGITRFGTPGAALAGYVAVALALLALSGFEGLLTYGTFVTWLFLSFTVVSVYVLRRTRPDAPRPYRTWGYPVTPLVFLAGTGFVLAVTLLQSPVESLTGVAVVALGVPLYLIGEARRRTAYAA